MTRYDLLLDQIKMLSRRQRIDITPLMSQIGIEIMGSIKGRILSPNTMRTSDGRIISYHPKKIKKIWLIKDSGTQKPIAKQPDEIKPETKKIEAVKPKIEAKKPFKLD